MAVVGDCVIWSTGSWALEDGITSFTLAEHLQSPLLSDGFGSGDSSAWSATVP